MVTKFEQSMVDYLRKKKVNGMTIRAFHSGQKIIAGIRGSVIRIQEYADGESMTQPLRDFCVTL